MDNPFNSTPFSLFLISKTTSQTNPFSQKKLQISIGYFRSKSYHSHGVMTFLSPLFRDTGTIFRIPKRTTFLWFTRAWVRTQLKISHPVDCKGLGKQQIYRGQQLSSLQKPRFLRFFASVGVFTCGRVAIPQAVI